MFVLTSKKVPMIGFFLIAVAVIVGINISHVTPITASPVVDSSAIKSNTLATGTNTADAQTLVTKPVTNNINQVIPIEIQTYTGSPAEAAEVIDWYTKHGMHSKSDDYDSYDQSALEKLASAGDIRAMHALARMYRDPAHLDLPEYGFDASMVQLWNAAVHGSIQAFTDIATYQEVAFYSHEKDTEKKRAIGLDVLALYKAQQLRGDRFASNSYVEKAVNPSAAEQELINSRAQQLYNELQEKRRALGLGNFDNSVPEVVERFFKSMEESSHHIK